VFVNLIDKIVFGALLLLLFQVPLVADHYLQFLSGYYDSTRNQVESYSRNAREHHYPHAYAMVDDFLRNPNAAVRRDAQQKMQTLVEYEELGRSINILREGFLIEKLWFMLNPARWDVLRKVLHNFKPGIPFSLSDVIYSAIMAMLLNLIIMTPIRLIEKSN